MTDRNKSGRPGADDDARRSDAFGERIGEVMRTPERLDITFEARVMSAVHAEARAGHAPHRGSANPVADWWLNPRVLRVSRLHTLTAGAIVVVLTLLGSLGVQVLVHRFHPDRAGLQANATDTVHIVRFVLVDPQAQSVSLVGDFNGWNKDATRLDVSGSGAWTVSLPLPRGRHEYAFIVQGEDGERWVADPYATAVRDEFDTESSVILVGGVQAGTTARASS